jgi:hypothetical protein
VPFGRFEEGCGLLRRPESLADESRGARQTYTELSVETDGLVEAERLGPEDGRLAYEPGSGSVDSKSSCFSPIL